MIELRGALVTADAPPPATAPPRRIRRGRRSREPHREQRDRHREEARPDTRTRPEPYPTSSGQPRGQTQHAQRQSLPETHAGGPVRLLGPVDLSLSERRIAIVGANGSGKSTLARLLNGLILPSSGQVLIDGLDTARDGYAVRRKVGFLFTDPDAQIVLPTPIEDVALSLRRTDVPAAAREDHARAALARVGLADRAHVPVRALSGGQRQLLALAAVLATEPEILICDEPTTLLDLRWRRVVTDLIMGLRQQVVLVTHDLDAAARADRVLVIDNGQVHADGPPAPTLDEYRALMDPDRPVVQ